MNDYTRMSRRAPNQLEGCGVGVPSLKKGDDPHKGMVVPTEMEPKVGTLSDEVVEGVKASLKKPRNQSCCPDLGARGATSSSWLVSTMIGSSMLCRAWKPALFLLRARMDGELGLTSARIPLKMIGLLVDKHNRSRRSATSTSKGLLQRTLRAPTVTTPWLDRCETSEEFLCAATMLSPNSQDALNSRCCEIARQGSQKERRLQVYVRPLLSQDKMHPAENSLTLWIGNQSDWLNTLRADGSMSVLAP
jgi:hypothetical protein